MNIGRKLEALRSNVGLQQDDVAKKLNVSKATVSNWERDKREPAYEMLDKLAELYKTTVSEIFSINNTVCIAPDVIKDVDNTELLNSTIINMSRNNDLNETDGFSNASESAKQILIGLLDLHIKKLIKIYKDSSLI
jgi:transcriptional regulator with XRE-family HTH domain